MHAVLWGAFFTLLILMIIGLVSYVPVLVTGLVALVLYLFSEA